LDAVQSADNNCLHQPLHDLAVDMLLGLMETAQSKEVAGADTYDMLWNVNSASMNTLR